MEAVTHNAMASERVSDQREFFKVPVDHAKWVLRDQLQDQLQDIVDLFTGWFSLTDEDCLIDASTVLVAASRVRLDTRDMNRVFENLTKEELDQSADRIALINPSFKERLEAVRAFKIMEDDGGPI